MIYEMRIYDAMPGKMPALNDRFANITLPYFEKYGLKVVGFWTEEVGTSNRLTYMLVFENEAQREKAWGDFRADSQRVADFAATERDGPLVAKIENSLMRPTSYSPLQ